jgi:15-cis-phytoene desaturase
MNRKRVIILGGGVAGMTAAHELSTGFDVVIYEKGQIAGGKARSTSVTGTTAGNNSQGQPRKNLPGEHGFRFFPGFYQHLFATMQEIPYGPKFVFHNLVKVKRGLIAIGKQSFQFGTGQPKSLADLITAFKTLLGVADLVPEHELILFARKIWRILCSCDERRLYEYERQSWWSFIEADRQSDAYQKYLAIGSTRSLVASQAQEASARTIGDIGIQLLFNFTLTHLGADYVLNGPTNEVWLDPWLWFLRQNGVDYRFGARVQEIVLKNGAVDHVLIRENGVVGPVQGDYYIAALPLDSMEKLLTPDMLKADPQLRGIIGLNKGTDALPHGSLRWMNGIQFYLKQPVTINGQHIEGHLNFLHSDWALTAIFQQDTWPNFPLTEFGDGTVREVLSVVISDWDAKNSQGKSAKECTQDEIRNEIWRQLKEGLNPLDPNHRVLDDANIHSVHLDSDIQSGQNGAPPHTNAEPLLVNLVGTWSLRPSSETKIPNLFLAGDYVKTNTDLATMESANEGGRRAVRGIHAAENWQGKPCVVFPIQVPPEIQKLRAWDRWLFKIGLPPPSLDAWEDNFPLISRIEDKVRSLFRLSSRSGSR